MNDTPDWHAAGCARDCTEQHTYKLGRCALSTEQPPEPTISIGRVETVADGERGIVFRSIPASVWDGLIAVVAHVSTGRSFAFDGQGPYPDAKARRVLGALHDGGLLPQPQPQPEPPAVRPDPACVIPGTCTHCGQPARAVTTWSHVPIRSDCQDPAATFQAATQAAEPSVPITDLRPLRPYEQQQGGYWLYPPGCDVYGNGRVWITAAQHEAAATASTEAPEPATVTDPAWLHRQYAAIISALHDNRPDHIAAELLRVHGRHLAQLRQRLRLADELLATRDAELAAAKKTARGIGAWGVLQAIEQALPQGPTVAEAAADDARWPLEKHGE